MICWQMTTFGQSQKEILHGIGIDFYSLFVLPAVQSVDDLGFDVIYRGFFKNGFVRMRFGINKDRPFPKGHKIYRRQLNETCRGNQVFASTYLQRRNFKFQFGYAFTQSLKKMTWYYGLDLGFEANYSWSRPGVEDCINTNPLSAIDESDTTMAMPNKMFLYEMMPVLGLYIPLNTNLNLSTEFGIPLRYYSGVLNYTNERFQIVSLNTNSFNLNTTFIQDIALVYHF